MCHLSLFLFPRFVLSCGKDSSVKLWEIGTGRLVKQYVGATHTQLRCQVGYWKIIKRSMCMRAIHFITIWKLRQDVLLLNFLSLPLYYCYCNIYTYTTNNLGKSVFNFSNLAHNLVEKPSLTLSEHFNGLVIFDGRYVFYRLFSVTRKSLYCVLMNQVMRLVLFNSYII